MAVAVTAVMTAALVVKVKFAEVVVPEVTA